MLRIMTLAMVYVVVLELVFVLVITVMVTKHGRKRRPDAFVVMPLVKLLVILVEFLLHF